MTNECDVKLVTYKKQSGSLGGLEVEAGSTGPREGDAGHGARAYIKLSSNGSASMTVNKLSEREVEMIFGGDLERDNIRQALQFAVDVLSGKVLESTVPDSHTGFGSEVSIRVIKGID
jgi:hypothetical protein